VKKRKKKFARPKQNMQRKDFFQENEVREKRKEILMNAGTASPLLGKARGEGVTKGEGGSPQ